MKRKFIFRFFFALTLCVAAYFLFYHLDHRYLWKDEAETALLAKSVNERGVPSAFLGKNRIFLHAEDQLRRGGIWTFHPWIQFYLAALSFKLFGESTWSARFPFAIFGFLTLLLAYGLALRVTSNHTVALLTFILLTFSIYFILHMRECRYYAPGVFFSLLFILCYLNFIDQKKFSFFSFLISGNLLFHTNYGFFIPINLAFLLHFLLYERNNGYFWKFLFLQGGLFATTFPCFMYYNGFQHSLKAFEWKRTSHHLQYYFRVIYKFSFPLFLILGMGLWNFFKRRHAIFSQGLHQFKKGSLGLFGFIIGSTLFLASIGDQHFYRYVIHLVPLFMILTATFFVIWFQFSSFVAPLSFIFVLTTNILHFSLPYAAMKLLPVTIGGELREKSKNQIYIPPSEFFYELNHGYRDLSKELVQFFEIHARPEDSIGIPYADHQLMFYTKFKIVNLYFEKFQYPTWIVLQLDWFQEVYGDVHQSDYYRTIEQAYEKIVTDIPDVQWSNRPDPYIHQFRSPVTYRKLVIFKKKS